MGMVNRQVQRGRSTNRHYPDVNRWTKFLGFLNYLWGTVMYAGGGPDLQSGGWGYGGGLGSEIDGDGTDQLCLA